jgi:hypothetical protein
VSRGTLHQGATPFAAGEEKKSYSSEAYAKRREHVGFRSGDREIAQEWKLLNSVRVVGASAGVIRKALDLIDPADLYLWVRDRELLHIPEAIQEGGAERSDAYILVHKVLAVNSVLFEQIQDGRDTWGIPSHDGKHLAFLQWTYTKTVWMIDGF